METFKSFERDLYQLNDQNIEGIALELFRFQAEHNPVYKSFITHLGRSNARLLSEIPFLPISFFKNHKVKSGDWIPEKTFISSGTTGVASSRHEVKDLNFYCLNSERIFRQFFGSLEEYHVLALLPSYLEREGSSLVAMAEYFIKQSRSPYSGFYLNNLEDLVRQLSYLRNNSCSPPRTATEPALRSDSPAGGEEAPKKVLLLGVTFALLELAEKSPMDLSHCMIMETGGMKGRRQEIIRDELHQFLCRRLNVPRIFSEYGMTELLSQAYSTGNGRFQTPFTMKVLIRDVNDPFKLLETGKNGGINIIDMANVHSCAFIETEDLGRVNQDGSFEVLGRMDNSDARGCNLLIG